MQLFTLLGTAVLISPEVLAKNVASSLRASSNHRNLKVPLANCANDCITMPLMVGYKKECNDNACNLGVMQEIGIDESKFRHLSGIGITLVDEISDEELDSLQNNENIKYIECDSCVVSMEDKPVCGSDDVTYTNVEELNCGLKCRDSDSSLSLAYEGACRAGGSATQNIEEEEEEEEEVAQFCTYSKPTSNSCAFKGTCQFNPRSCLDETDRSEIVFDTCECRDGVFNCEDVELVCDDVEPSCPQEMPIPNSACNIEDLQCNYNPFGCPEREEKDEEPYGIWLEGCTCEGGSWLCAAYDIKCPRNEPIIQDDDDSVGSAVDNNDDEICGSPTDNCMNEQNHQECIDLKQAGCSNIGHYESCPTQFFCDDNSSIGGAVEDIYAELGETCEGFDEVTGKPFPSCRPGMKCESTDESSIPGAGKECVMEDDGASQSSDIPLGNCDADCMTMPLIVTFTEDCDVSCATQRMKTSGIEKTNYRHLANLNFVFLDEVTDDQLTALRRSEDVNSIECDSCSVGIEDAHVCGSDGFTYKNEDDLNCELKCRGVDKSITLAHYGVCPTEEASTAEEFVKLGNCDDDCMTMPLMITFKDICDTDCAADTMNASNIDKEHYDHLTNINIILLKEVTDEELAVLQSKGEFISSIECDSCVSIAGVEQVCGTNGVTYKNKEELECGLKCRGADKTVEVTSEGACSPGFDELISLACDEDCMRMPLLIGFDNGCNNACALETMQRANIPKSNYDHLTALNIILLNTVTDDQLMVLRGEQDDIEFIECDACVSIEDNDEICADNGITFRNAQELTCENQCRETTTEISISYRGPCNATLPPGEGGWEDLPTICFSSLNEVQLSDGERKQMHQLQLGDEVLTHGGRYEAIYSWSHHNSEKDAQFVQLLPSRVELSPNHLIFLESSNGAPVPASAIKAGDVLSSGEIVTSVRSVKRRGVYAPFTKSGTIVVNGQTASTYVSLQEKSSVLLLGSWSTGISHQWLAHTFEIPHRLWCSLGGGCTRESYTSDGISTWVATPLRFFTWSLKLPTIFQAILFLPILVLFGILAAFEFLFKNYVIVTATTSCIFIASGVFYSSSGIRFRHKTTNKARIVFV